MVEKSLVENYHTGWRGADHYSQKAHDAPDLRAHVRERLESDRRLVVPWLDDAKPLHGQQILEIGCGTGSSTIALAEAPR